MFGAPPAPLFIALAAAAVIGIAVLLWRARRLPIPEEGATEAGGIGSLILSPLLLWIGAILFFMLF